MSWKKASPPPDPPNPLLDNAFRTRLGGLIGRSIRNAADVEDLVQETLLHAMVTAARHSTTEAPQIEKIAQRIAHNLVAQQQRGRLRKPETSGLPDDVVDSRADSDDALIAETREHLRSMRAQLEPHLGSSQRALLDAYLDGGIARPSALAAQLGTTRTHVARMLLGIAKQVFRLTARGST